MQLKASNESDKTEDMEKEIKWLNHKCKDAKKQVKNSIMYIRAGTHPAFENVRGQQVTIYSNAEIIPVVVFMNEDIGNHYEHVLRKHSDLVEKANRSSPRENDVTGHKQRYHTKDGVIWKDKAPYHRGGKDS